MWEWNMPLTQLPQSTIRLIGSTQVISSVSSVVKELMENALDAGATNINIKLEKHGLDKIEIKDDGCGISRSDTAVMCLPYYTSKITEFNDLNNLNSYGFRGEALSSLCAVSQVSITTKTVEDEVGMCYSLDTNGQVISAKVSTILKGTIVTVTDLFKCLPVRKQLMSSSRRSSEELKKVENIVKSLAVIHPKLRVTLTHNKFLIWQKISVSNLLQSVRQILPQSVVKQLHYLQDISDWVGKYNSLI
uniref:DNA mismatch repair protein S5 domain-containing protein n=1 Tax=Clastoptera arizonana TaxID=38151 RepID=A0A1B6CZP1_9HEMI